MESLELEILEACSAAELCQREMLPHLAASLDVPVEGVFYAWAFRRCRQHGEIPNSPWRYFFHGLECDLKNRTDGRFLRLDFGPRGRVDTFTAWGVLQFIMTSAAPWSDFASLKQQFARKDPPYDPFSGDFPRFCESWDRLESQECFDRADPDLIEFLARCTSVGPDGVQRVAFPPGTPEEIQINCSVAHRQCLSAHARQLLESRLAVRGAPFSPSSAIR